LSASGLWRQISLLEATTAMEVVGVVVQGVGVVEVGECPPMLTLFLLLAVVVGEEEGVTLCLRPQTLPEAKSLKTMTTMRVTKTKV
jgi:hypothetical protein